MNAKRSLRPHLVNAALAAGALLIALLAAEPLLRLRYAEPVPVTPEEVLQVQPYLRTDPVFGFTWKPGISASKDIVFEIADIEFEPLSTDRFGIINHPEAIAAQKRGGGVDVVGLGDSFMEMAAHDFYEGFAERGLRYYSLAIHRQAPPHYAALFEAYAADLAPRLAIVGVFENDFAESADFDRWKASGLDWFTFHSGTWCGRPVPANAVERFTRRHFRGYRGLARVIQSRLRGERMSVNGPSDYRVARVKEELLRIAGLAEPSDIVLLFVFIPSRATATGDAPTAEAAAYDAVIAALKGRSLSTLDLRPIFSEHPDPASLYYKQDGHWNDRGIAAAARHVLRKADDMLGAAAGSRSGRSGADS